jgi:hypothetical protein
MNDSQESLAPKHCTLSYVQETYSVWLQASFGKFSVNSLQFMESCGLLPHNQDPAADPYSEPYKSNLYLPVLLF